MVFDAYEEGRLDLDFYLDHTVFYKKRAFTRARFKAFLFGQSKPMPGMLEFVAGLKARHRLKVVVVSNEARALNAHRIRAFNLGALVDMFVSSCFVGLRKPDPAMFQLALDLAQVPARQVLYLENTQLFVQVAKGLGIRGIVHQDLDSTRAALAAAGLD
jgi:putative hydrolase of the HAD superfamily